MRKFFLIFPFIITFAARSYSQAEISLNCDNQWGPGRYNKVLVKIDFALSGFTRFTLDFPVGFNVAGNESQGNDISWTGDQLNVVCMNAGPERPLIFSFYIKPESSMQGNFNLQGELVIITGGVTKHLVKLKEKSIEITGSNGLLPAEMKDKTIVPVTEVPVETRDTGKKKNVDIIIFRVQVSASSVMVKEAQIRKDIGLDPEVKITVVKSGSSFKYQAGEFSDYKDAGSLLSSLKGKGIKGAFIVAIRNGEQK